MENPRDTKKENALLWFIKIFAGFMLLGVLGLHFVVNHLVAPEGLLSYADVVLYYQNPWVVGMEIGFLIVVVIHALLGLRSILLDLNLSSRSLRVVNYFFLIVGAIAIVYGIWLALEIAGRSV